MENPVPRCQNELQNASPTKICDSECNEIEEDKTNYEDNRQFARFKNLRKSTKVRKSILLFFVMGTLSGLVYHLHSGVDKFLSYPVAPVIMKDHNQFKLPTLLICHPYFIKGHKIGYLNANPVWTYVFDGYENNLKQFWNYALMGSLNHTEYSDKAGKHLYDFFMIRSFLPFYAKVANLSLGPEDSLLLCLFNWKPCDFRNFTVIYHAEKGACFLYEQPDNLSFTHTGVGHGLTFFFTLMKSVLSSHTNKSELLGIDGLKFYLFANGHWLPVDQEPDVAQTGWLSAHGVGSSTYERLSTPNYHCLTAERVWRGHLSRNGEIAWRLYFTDDSLCRNDHSQLRLIGTCGCFAYDWLIKEEHITAGLPYCLELPLSLIKSRSLKSAANASVTIHSLFSDDIFNLNDIVDTDLVRQRMLCYYAVYNKIKSEKTNPCPQFCKTTSITKTFNRFNLNYQMSTHVFEILHAFYETRYAYIGTDVPNLAFQYFYQVQIMKKAMQPSQGGAYQIYPTTLSTDYTYEVRRYEGINYFADLGGTLTLWLSASALTVLKLFYWIVNWCHQRRKSESYLNMD